MKKLHIFPFLVCGCVLFWEILIMITLLVLEYSLVVLVVRLKWYLLDCGIFGYYLVARYKLGEQRSWRVGDGWGRGWGYTHKIKPSNVLQNTYRFWYQHPRWIFRSSKSCRRLFPSFGAYFFGPFSLLQI